MSDRVKPLRRALAFVVNVVKLQAMLLGMIFRDAEVGCVAQSLRNVE